MVRDSLSLVEKNCQMSYLIWFLETICSSFDLNFITFVETAENVFSTISKLPTLCHASTQALLQFLKKTAYS